jgi:DNA repair protein RadC
MRKKPGGIAAWPESERPRERLLSQGPHVLTDAELIAILLRIGYAGTNAVELARQLLERFGSLQAMVRAPAAALLTIKGLKAAKAAQLSAAMEIARRAAMPNSEDHVFLKNTTQAAEYLRAKLGGLSEEHFRVAFLNRQGRLLGDALIATGTVDSVHPPIRKIVEQALQLKASALIAAHNHPSGKAEPSDSDKILTRDIIAACHPIGIKVLDHVIVAEAANFSFADSGLLDELALETLSPAPRNGATL